EWVGKDVPKNIKPAGAGIIDLALMDRPADPAKGKIVYDTKCSRCHGANGEGLKMTDTGSYFTNPPLWGDQSYNTGAGLLRLSRFAGYVKLNMPFDSKLDTAVTVDQCWDVAAFVNSQPRPDKRFPQDWPNINKKPFDHPFGPYSDGFSERQHKFGPFKEIKEKQLASIKKAGQ
ncbi:MAG: c-type cytochrome, partial [Chitinophagaceae bacterium]|nr:c-type cytochrome [Chitinophagaceae bacterium]